MKKSISFILVVTVLLCCFTSCDITANFSDALSGKAESTPKVEEMLLALAENDMSAAESLLHPQIAGDSGDMLERLADYIDGRKAESVEVTSVGINTSTGTGGKSRQEEISCEVKLDDGDSVALNVVYLSDNQGEGFSVFQIVL